ncbi:MAG TPA: flagellar hook-length control protein FliK, partial [Roseiarcus sp.]|nr:flagellar hook-length control protein FliK [Roseiarcus sp.]
VAAHGAPGAAASSLTATALPPAMRTSEPSVSVDQGASANDTGGVTANLSADPTQGVVMPTAAAVNAAPAVATAAPEVVNVHVLRRTYLGLDSVALAAKANAGSQSTMIAASAAAGASSAAGQHQSAGGGAGRGEQGGTARNAASEQRDIALSPTSAASDIAPLASGASAGVATSLTLEQLPDFVAAEAGALVAQSGAKAPSADATSASTSGPVKELDVELNPANLGAVTVKMRIANGSLAVVIETAKPSTQKLIESERQTISDRLTSVDQPVASLVIKASDAVQIQGESSNATNSGPAWQSSGGSGGGANNSQEQARYASSQGGGDERQTRQTTLAENGMAIGDRLGDIFV